MCVHTHTHTHTHLDRLGQAGLLVRAQGVLDGGVGVEHDELLHGRAALLGQLHNLREVAPAYVGDFWGV